MKRLILLISADITVLEHSHRGICGRTFLEGQHVLPIETVVLTHRHRQALTLFRILYVGVEQKAVPPKDNVAIARVRGEAFNLSLLSPMIYTIIPFDGSVESPGAVTT